MERECEQCSDRDLLALRSEQYRFKFIELKRVNEELVARIAELTGKLEHFQAQKLDKDALVLAEAQVRALQELVQELQKQLEANKKEIVALYAQQLDVRDKEVAALRALNQRFLAELKKDKFNLCIVHDQLFSAHDEIKRLRSTIENHVIVLRILETKVEVYEKEYLKGNILL